MKVIIDGVEYKPVEKRVTDFKAGMHFAISGESYILCTPRYNEICLINVRSGARWRDAVKITNPAKISLGEFDKAVGQSNYQVL